MIPQSEGRNRAAGTSRYAAATPIRCPIRNSRSGCASPNNSFTNSARPVTRASANRSMTRARRYSANIESMRHVGLKRAVQERADTPPEIGHHHHSAGHYLPRYARASSWREDNRRMSNGEQVVSWPGWR